MILCRFALTIALVLTTFLVGAADRAAAAGCTSSVGPGIPAPAQVPAGLPGFHAAWFGQSGYMALCGGDEAVATVAYYNSGSRGWVAGKLGEVAYLGTWNPSPGQDQPSVLGGDGASGSPNTAWPRFNRVAVQPAPYVGPGQVAWFQFRVRAPITPGRYSLALRPLVEGAQWMEDYGVFWNVVVLNPDGTQPPITIGGLNFTVASGARADVYVETTIPKADATKLAAQVDLDVARIESDFGRAFNGRPVLYAFGSEASANVGNITIAQMHSQDAIDLAHKEGGFFDPSTQAIFLNWFQFATAPLTTPRHELTHKLIDQLAGPFTAVPAWFNEGNARLEEFTIPGSAWLGVLNRYTAASAAAGNTLLPLSDLVSQATWNGRSAPYDQFEYYEASQAAQLVRQDVGLSGTVAILELMRGGASFDAAFQLVTGRTTADYSILFPARLRATVGGYPGVALANDTQTGAGLTVMAYGFAAATTVAVTISTPGYVPSNTTMVTDGFGTATTYAPVARGWPPTGSYTVSVSDGARTVTVTTTLP